MLVKLCDYVDEGILWLENSDIAICGVYQQSWQNYPLSCAVFAQAPELR